MANDSEHDMPGFGDLLSEVEDGSFAWDEEEVEPETEEVTRPVVSFRLAEDLFAVSGTAVREIVGAMETTHMPGAPDHIRGITVLRRQVVGLLSLRHFLGLPLDDLDAEEPDKNGVGDTARTLIVETAHYTVGLLVDEVTGLSQWPESALDPKTLPDNIHDQTRRYARGAHAQQGNLCIYLDLELLLDNAAIQ